VANALNGSLEGSVTKHDDVSGDVCEEDERPL
jgi:hypothetical protein